MLGKQGLHQSACLEGVILTLLLDGKVVGVELIETRLRIVAISLKIRAQIHETLVVITKSTVDLIHRVLKL